MNQLIPVNVYLMYLLHCSISDMLCVCSGLYGVEPYLEVKTVSLTMLFWASWWSPISWSEVHLL